MASWADMENDELPPSPFVRPITGMTPTDDDGTWEAARVDRRRDARAQQWVRAQQRKAERARFQAQLENDIASIRAQLRTMEEDYVDPSNGEKGPLPLLEARAVLLERLSVVGLGDMMKTDAVARLWAKGYRFHSILTKTQEKPKVPGHQTAYILLSEQYGDRLVLIK